MPPIISVLSNVKRGKPAGLPNPMQDTNKPSNKVTTPLTGLAVVITMAQVRPNKTNQKYSKELKRKANSARVGEANISTKVPNRPPMAENTKLAPKASSDCPLRVSA